MSNPTNKLKRIHTDDLFSSEQQRQENTTEKIQQLPLADCHPFPNHPFKVLDNEDMEKMVESIENYGMLLPAIARPDSDGGYQIVAGHRRHHACALAGLETMPTIVRDMDDDTAAILMVDSNLQRENILPSERAFAFKIKLDAMKRQSAIYGVKILVYPWLPGIFNDCLHRHLCGIAPDRGIPVRPPQCRVVLCCVLRLFVLRTIPDRETYQNRV